MRYIQMFHRRHGNWKKGVYYSIAVIKYMHKVAYLPKLLSAIFNSLAIAVLYSPVSKRIQY